jgi:hypothetical protein
MVYGLHLLDLGVLLAWEIDSTEALIARTDHDLRQASPEELFEGWYADETSYCDVFNPRNFLKVDI